MRKSVQLSKFWMRRECFRTRFCKKKLETTLKNFKIMYKILCNKVDLTKTSRKDCLVVTAAQQI